MKKYFLKFKKKSKIKRIKRYSFEIGKLCLVSKFKRFENKGFKTVKSKKFRKLRYYRWLLFCRLKNKVKFYNRRRVARKYNYLNARCVISKYTGGLSINRWSKCKKRKYCLKKLKGKGIKSILIVLKKKKVKKLKKKKVKKIKKKQQLYLRKKRRKLSYVLRKYLKLKNYYKLKRKRDSFKHKHLLKKKKILY